MQNIVIVFVIFISVTVFDECLGYPSGAPSGQCEQMTPNHGSPPQTGASPYEIKVTKTYYGKMSEFPSKVLVIMSQVI